MHEAVHSSVRIQEPRELRRHFLAEHLRADLAVVPGDGAALVLGHAALHAFRVLLHELKGDALPVVILIGACLHALPALAVRGLGLQLAGHDPVEAVLRTEAQAVDLAEGRVEDVGLAAADDHNSVRAVIGEHPETVQDLRVRGHGRARELLLRAVGPENGTPVWRQRALVVQEDGTGLGVPVIAEHRLETQVAEAALHEVQLRPRTKAAHVRHVGGPLGGLLQLTQVLVNPLAEALRGDVGEVLPEALLLVLLLHSHDRVHGVHDCLGVPRIHLDGPCENA
mmetsp:Transcript_50898/g.145477  ORF Transcript_50898/g.145477 Transcript_50898/m.145477 type:complete len:282 (+) Transcript_50898:588-1433(+)